MARVLIIEDDPAIAAGLAESLAFEGYDVVTAADGKTGYAACRDHEPDLIVLDVMLPAIGGFDLCRRIRKDGMQSAILMLTARDSETDRVSGLDLGADDYVTKPFSLPELMARVRALLRRNQPPSAAADELRFGDVAIDFRRYEARRGKRPIKLTRKEFEILRRLAVSLGEVVTREQLLSDVWGYDNFPSTRTVDNHIATLRAKLEADPGRPEHIRTVIGIGYKLVRDADS